LLSLSGERDVSPLVEITAIFRVDDTNHFVTHARATESDQSFKMLEQALFVASCR
jgi:hypothetical protein